MRPTLLAVAASFGLVVPVHAAWEGLEALSQYKKPNVHWGQLALHPYYTLSEQHDSNIYLTPGDRRESWITRNDLGVEASLPRGRADRLDFGYGFDAQVYSAQPGANNAFNQQAHADYSRAGAHGLSVRAADRYENTNDQATSELVGRSRRWFNDARAAVEYEPPNGRLTAGLSASQRNDKYLSPDLAQGLNRYEQGAGVQVGCKLAPQTKLYGSYRRSLIHYSVPEEAATGLNKNSRSHSAGFGVEGRLSPKIEGKAEAGFTYREYEKAPVAGGGRAFTTPTVATSVVYKPGPRTSATLSLRRYFEESISAANAFYRVDEASLELRRKLPRSLEATLALSLGRDSYENAQALDAGGATATRRDDLYGVQASLAYDVQEWLRAAANYQYAERDSTIGGFDYADSRVTVSAGLKF